MHMVRHKWNEIGPSYLLSENGDLSFLLYSCKIVLGRDHSGLVLKKLFASFFISKESP